MKSRSPNSPCTENTLFYFFLSFYGFFLRFVQVVCNNSGHFLRVNKVIICAFEGAFLFSLVDVMYLNISSYLYGKQIKSNKSWEISRIYEWCSF